MLLNRIVLFQLYGVEPKSVASVTREIRSEGFFAGGVCEYKAHAHIDTRVYNADW